MRTPSCEHNVKSDGGLRLQTASLTKAKRPNTRNPVSTFLGEGQFVIDGFTGRGGPIDVEHVPRRLHAKIARPARGFDPRRAA